jgi:hypothetical protein
MGPNVHPHVISTNSDNSSHDGNNIRDTYNRALDAIRHTLQLQHTSSNTNPNAGVSANRSSSRANEFDCDGVILITGTAFIMSEARAALGVKEPRDGDILMELTLEQQQHHHAHTNTHSGGADTKTAVIGRDSQVSSSVIFLANRLS